MAKIADLPDFSQFVQKVGGVKVHNSVNFLIGHDVIEVNGIVISQKSQVLLDLVVNSSDIDLDEFAGELNGVQDCIELLYGGLVEISTYNIETISRFSVRFEIQEMYNLCLDWIREKICRENIYLFLDVGLMVEEMLEEKQDILNICSDYIKGEIKDDLFVISKNWNFDDVSLIKFFIRKDILPFTLPVITACIDSDDDVSLILDQFEVMGITEELSKDEGICDELMKKMSERAEVVETIKRLLRLKFSSPSKSSSSDSKDIKDLTRLLSQNYVSLSFDQIINIEKEYNLAHYQFVEVVVHWITHNNPSQSEVANLWGRVKQQELSYWYVCCVRHTIGRPRGRNSYSIPHVVDLDNTEYQYYSAWWGITCYTIRLSAAQLDSLLNKRTVVLNMECGKCYGRCDVKIKLDDKTPCYELDVDNTHCTVKHWYIVWYDDGLWHHYSLITNNYSSVIAKIKECMRNYTKIALYCFYQCVKK